MKVKIRYCFFLIGLSIILKNCKPELDSFHFKTTACDLHSISRLLALSSGFSTLSLQYVVMFFQTMNY